MPELKTLSLAPGPEKQCLTDGIYGWCGSSPARQEALWGHSARQAGCPPARGPPHRRALRSPALCQHQPILSQAPLVVQCKELLVHGAAPAA